MASFMKKQQYKKKCNVCMHAGKSEDIYMSHNTKDEKGRVVCPTLMAQKCSYCKATGHTPKYCPLAKQHAKEDKRRTYEDKKAVQVLKKQQTKKKDRDAKNYFAGLLDYDDEDDSEVEQEDKEETAIKLTLAPRIIVPHNKAGNDFLNALKSKGEQEKEEDRQLVVKLPSIINPSVLEEKEKKEKKPMLWAEMEDSDDDDDYY